MKQWLIKFIKIINRKKYKITLNFYKTIFLLRRDYRLNNLKITTSAETINANLGDISHFVYKNKTRKGMIIGKILVSDPLLGNRINYLIYNDYLGILNIKDYKIFRIEDKSSLKIVKTDLNQLIVDIEYYCKNQCLLDKNDCEKFCKLNGIRKICNNI